MAASVALSFYTTSPPARSCASGAAVITNDATPRSIVNMAVTGPKNMVVECDLAWPTNPPVANGYTQGAGANPPDFALAANQVLSVPFQFVAVGGTWAVNVYFSDGTSATATQSITPV